MAEIYNVNGAQVKKRSPWKAWGLSVVTLGIYSLVWYYKVNKEMRQSNGVDVDPAMSVVAFTVGACLIAPPFVSLYKTARRVDAVQTKAGVQERISPVLCLLLVFIPLVNYLFPFVPYIQSHLNKAWEKQGSPSLGEGPGTEGSAVSDATLA